MMMTDRSMLILMLTLPAELLTLIGVSYATYNHRKSLFHAIRELRPVFGYQLMHIEQPVAGHGRVLRSQLSRIRWPEGRRRQKGELYSCCCSGR